METIRNVLECNGIDKKDDKCIGMKRNVNNVQEGKDCIGTYQNVFECTAMQKNE